MNIKKFFVSGIITAALVIFFDQITKKIILQHFFSGARHQSVTSFFDLVLVYNKGVSFGLLTQDSRLGTNLLILLASVITITLIIWLWQAKNWLQSLAYGFVIGGACGNIIDRVAYGAVTDFLLFHWHQYAFPAFNIADCCITVGAILIFLENLFVFKEQHHNVT